MGIGLRVVNFLGPTWEGSFSEQSVSGWALAMRGSQGQPLPSGMQDAQGALCSQDHIQLQ